MKQYRLPIIMLAIFEAVAISLWLTKDNAIREVEYKIAEYGLTGRMNPDNVLCSTIDFPYFNETSYLMPYESSEVTERNLKNVHNACNPQ